MSESCHVRPIRCLRTEMYLARLEIWRIFILGMWSLQTFCWDLLHSVVPHHLHLHLLAMKGQFCISSYTLSLHFRPVLPLAVFYTFSCLCLSQLLQSSFCFNNRNLFLSAALPLVRCRRASRKKLLLLISSFYRKDLIKISSNWKKHRFSCREIQGVAMLTLFFFNTVPPRGCHSHPDLFVSSLFPWKFMLRLPHSNVPLVFS